MNVIYKFHFYKYENIYPVEKSDLMTVENDNVG